MTSRDQQVKAVCEGLALGTVALGVSAVTSGKMDLEFALAHAWRNWSESSHFPSIQGHHADNYLYLGFNKSARRRHAFGAWESTGKWWLPYVTMDGWTVEECTAILAEHDEQIGHESWVDLATLFVNHLGEDRIRRET